MNNFYNLEQVFYKLGNQKIFRGNFFREYHDKYLNNEINSNDLQFPVLMDKSKIVDVEKMSDIIEEKDGEYYFTPEATYIIKEHFGILKKKQDSDIGEDEYNTEREILGIISREEFEKKYPNVKLEKQKTSYEFVPTPGISYNDFCVLCNNYPNPKFIQNPHLNIRPYSSNATTNLQKIEVVLKRQVTSDDRFGKKIATKFSIQCKCGKSLNVFPSDIHSSISHFCGMDMVNGKEKPIFTRLEKNGLCPISEKELWIYEAKIPNVKIPTKMDTVYLYTMEPDISPGKYIIDVWNAYVWDQSKKSYVFLPIALSYKRKEIEVDENLITLNHPKAKEYCKSKGLPYAKFLDVLFSAKDVIKTHGGRDLDERGMLLQLAITASAIAKHGNMFDKLGVLSMGNKSLSKTYPSYLLGSIFDEDFQHVGSSQDISLAGLRGGIDNNHLINGQRQSMFVKGVFSVSGLTLFDEGELFFADKDMNMVLKTFLDESIDIKKIGGGGKIEQTYTPLIMSNFPIGFNIEYTKEIQKAYEMYNKINNEEHSHGQSKEEIASYIAEVNLYLPVSRYVNDYHNQTLAKVVAYIRHKFKAKGVDWRTGGSLPASYRLLLDFVCWNVEEHSFDDEDRIIGKTDAVLPDDGVFPTTEFIETFKSFYSEFINLKFENENSVSTVEKLDSLSTDIDNWFRTDDKGKILFLHLSDGTIQIDPKVNGLVYVFIKTLQICEDMLEYGEFRGNFSDNIKEWVFLILSKCKRGITKDEYDFLEHYDDIAPKNEKFSMLEAEIEKIRSMEEEDNLVNKLSRRLEEKNMQVEEPSLNEYSG